MIAAAATVAEERRPQPYRIGVRWVVIDRLEWRPTGWIKGGRRCRRGRSVPPRFWDGAWWADDYLHAMTFDSEDAARKYIRRIFCHD